MIATEGLSFCYRGGQNVIDSFTHQFAAGTITAVTGPSGRGKSTLLYLLGLMLTPTRGTVVWGGEDVSSLPDGMRSALRAASIGFVFQDAVLDPARTVMDNVMEGALYGAASRKQSRARAHELLRVLGVEPRHDHLPGQISGGQAQRVALARALVKSPQVILADEPTGNLDPTSAAVVWSVLRAQADAGATVVVATHDPRRVNDCDVQVSV